MKYIKPTKYIIILLLAIIFVLGIANWSTRHKLANSLDEVKDYKFRYSLYKDSLGREHASFKIDPHHVNELLPKNGVIVRDQAKALGVNPDNIKSVTKVSTSITAPIKFSIDTPNFNDGHLFLNTIKAEDTLVGTYIYKDTAWFVTFTKDKRILGIKYKSLTYGDVHFGNINTTITGLNSISIDKYVKPRHFGIGPSFGVTYIDGWKPYFGIGITYSLIKW